MECGCKTAVLSQVFVGASSKQRNSGIAVFCLFSVHVLMDAHFCRGYEAVATPRHHSVLKINLAVLTASESTSGIKGNSYHCTLIHNV